MLRAGLAGLEQAGFSQVTLWVLDANERARRFYQRFGFTDDGTRKDAVLGGATLVEIRYRLAFNSRDR